MTKYAVIVDGAVTNLVRAGEDGPLDNWVEAGNAKVGDLYDGSIFTTPEPEPPTADEQFEIDLLADQQALKDDSQVRALLRARPAQIDSYIDNNVTDLASAKAVLKILGRAVAVLGARIIK